MKLNYLKIEIETEKGKYGFQSSFEEGLNIIASDDNTKGKSGIVSAIFYALGFEDILGGKGNKALSQAFKNNIVTEENKNLPVLESRIYLEITNQSENITLLRYGKSEQINDKLIRVFKSSYEKIYNETTETEDFYVNVPMAAKNKKGFHLFLEKFLKLKLPLVPSSDGDRKLYLQLIFSLCFIEQKHGWGGILSGMPIFGISDSKKRIIEYTLKLNTLKNEIEKERLQNLNKEISVSWNNIKSNLLDIANFNILTLNNFPNEICILDEKIINNINFKKDNLLLKDKIFEIKKHIETNLTSIKIINDESRLVEKQLLTKTQELISKKYVEIKNLNQEIEEEKNILEKHKEMNAYIIHDLSSNKDLKKLKNYGSDKKIKCLQDVCPTCGSKLQDSLLSGEEIMSLDQNIAHLSAQKELFDYTIKNQSFSIEQKELLEKRSQSELNELLKKERIIKEDLVKINNDISEIEIYNKFKLNEQIEEFKKANKTLNLEKKKLLSLSNQYKNYLIDLKKLPKKNIDNYDSIKLIKLGEYFREYLKIFRYKSYKDLDNIIVSDFTFLPTINGFDIKYDTSASDEIRAVWSYLLAINKLTFEYETNFSNILIFDEPKQQSIVEEDFERLLNEIIEKFDNKQAIIAATIKDEGTKKIISKLDKDKYKLISFEGRAFKKLEN